jgi:hypothetical protein
MQQMDYGFLQPNSQCVAFLGFNLLGYHIDNIYIYPFIVSCECHKCKSTSPILGITLWVSNQTMYKPDGAFNSFH